jgi:three-Cys-motif partner protein
VRELVELDNDGLHIPEVGDWAERKYRIIAVYTQMFATAMRLKWRTRSYIDLFAAAGRARLKDSGKIIATSATLALEVRHPFDRHVLCEIEPENADALKQRIRRDFPSATADVLLGDCNENVVRILDLVPRGSRTSRSLSFCVADPYRLSDLRFSTIECLATRFVDFLILVASYMDAHRNRDTYLLPSNTVVENFLGDPGWRSKWMEVQRGSGSREFGAFVVDQLGQRMRSLGYLYKGPTDTVTVKDRGRVLYHLTFFSRHPMGRRFWDQARRYSTDQPDLFG